MNIAFAGAATVLWLLQKLYYRRRNAQNARAWAAMSDGEREREEQEAEAEGKGNRSVTFRFTT